MTRGARDIAGVVVVALITLGVVKGCDGSAMREALDRAEIAEDSIAILRPQVEAALTQARVADTTLAIVTDTVEIVIERVRTERVEILDTLVLHVDSVGAEALDELVTSHAVEIAALESLANERLLWGTSWRNAARLLEAENTQLRMANAALHDAIDASRRRTLAFGTSTTLLAGAATYLLVTGL